jgi:hypothetical protein
MPRWVKIAGTIAVVAVVAIAALHLTGHMPGMMSH